MKQLLAQQSCFSEQVFSADQAIDDRLKLQALAGLEKRMAVYRNNVNHSLIQALADSYPVVQKLVGEEFFTGMAREYLLEHPPRSAVLLEFGTDFSEFIAAFEPARELPYLPDVARLERFWQEAYHAPDAGVLSAEDLGAISPEELGKTSLVLHPSVRILASRYAVGSIWQANQDDCEDKELNVDQEEYLVSLRVGHGLDMHVQICFIDEPGFYFLLRLQAEAGLGEAMQTVVEKFPEWDAGATLAFALQNEFFSEVITD